MPGRRAIDTDYATARAAEGRADCLSCGCSDARCTAMVLHGKPRTACCGTCAYTDTHPKPDAPPEHEPCSRCGGTGVEPAP